MRTRVKICGLRHVDDVVAAAKAGADALGFVFYPPSPRAVDIRKAAHLVAQVPSFITSVGLFVNASAAEIEQVLQQVPLTLLQFHGDESPDFCQQFDMPWIKAVRMRPDINLLQVQDNYHQARGLLLDTYRKGTPGGTGASFDWHAIPADLRPDIILAGGLDASNIR
ncbi:MAG: phosphoribosylanthranilate isomerase, partial [Gammaproteobacteria bacterium]|nr:phosphoribosylanthranilate isomerase [Gammaproteobacteria bacterium]